MQSVLCQTLYNTATSQKTYEREKHEGVKYACNQCDQQFTKQDSLTTHIQTKHEGVKYACNQCDQQFTQQDNLTRHVQYKHEGINYACNQCNYQATSQGDLMYHIQSSHFKLIAWQKELKKDLSRKHFNVPSEHAKKKVICCPECGLLFSSNNAMESHFLQVHPQFFSDLSVIKHEIRQPILKV